MNPTKILCPGCGTTTQAPLLTLPAEPVVLNYRYDNPRDSMSCARAPMEISECRLCGLIHNTAFQPSLIPYDNRYENTQAHSSCFNDHIASIITTLTERYGLSSSTRILEIGCGKGDFLKAIHKAIGCEGIGYDTTYEGRETLMEGKLQFHKRYYTLKESIGRFDLIICRHVIEHIPDIEKFLLLLGGAASKYDKVPVVVETPAFEWISQKEAFWDIFYEHCNYFTMPCLRSLFERYNFKVEFQSTSFEGQYQLLGGISKSNDQDEVAAPAFRPILADFASKFWGKIDSISEKINRFSQGKNWGIWGAGAKGVTLASRLPEPPSFLIDSNPKKQGCYAPGTNIPIISPQDAKVAEASLVLIANPAYYSEVEALMKAAGYSASLLALD